MMAAADGNSTRVKRLAHGQVSRPSTRNDTTPRRRSRSSGPMMRSTRNGLQAVQQAPGERAPVLGESGPVQPLQPFGRRAESYSAGNWRCARFEAARRNGIGGAFQSDLFDHLAAAHEGWQALKTALTPPQHADAGRAEHLVSGEGVEIGAQRLNVDRSMRRALSTVKQHLRTHRFCRFDNGGVSVTAPVTFEQCVTEINWQRFVTMSFRWPRSSRPSGVTLTAFTVMPARSTSICHGTILLWCSSSEMTTSSPGLSKLPKEWATRLMADVAP